MTEIYSAHEHPWRIPNLDASDLFEGQTYSFLPVSVVRKLIKSKSIRVCRISIDAALSQILAKQYLDIPKAWMLRILTGMRDDYIPYTYSVTRTGARLTVWGDADV